MRRTVPKTAPNLQGWCSVLVTLSPGPLCCLEQKSIAVNAGQSCAYLDVESNPPRPSNVCLVGENPTCSVPPLQGCEGLWSYDYGQAHTEYTPPPPPSIPPIVRTDFVLFVSLAAALSSRTAPRLRPRWPCWLCSGGERAKWRRRRSYPLCPGHRCDDELYDACYAGSRIVLGQIFQFFFAGRISFRGSGRTGSG